MKKANLTLCLLVGLLSGSIFLVSCTKTKPQSSSTPALPTSAAIEVTYSVPQINAIIANRITYTDADNKLVVVENAPMPWSKKIKVNPPFTATLKIENSLIPNADIPDLITLNSGYTISCSGAVDKTQTFSSSMTIKKEKLDQWLARPAKEYSYTFSIEDR